MDHLPFVFVEPVLVMVASVSVSQQVVWQQKLGVGVVLLSSAGVAEYMDH